ncbi:MAG: hypothetical protein ABSH20_24560 [Tepidisphaeraceae bacterium]
MQADKPGTKIGPLFYGLMTEDIKSPGAVTIGYAFLQSGLRGHHERLPLKKGLVEAIKGMNPRVIREKPYLYVDGSSEYCVLVPALQINTRGVTWAHSPTPGASIPIDQFSIAQPQTATAKSINAALVLPEFELRQKSYQ